MLPAGLQMFSEFIIVRAPNFSGDLRGVEWCALSRVGRFLSARRLGVAPHLFQGLVISDRPGRGQGLSTPWCHPDPMMCEENYTFGDKPRLCLLSRSLAYLDLVRRTNGGIVQSIICLPSPGDVLGPVFKRTEIENLLVTHIHQRLTGESRTPT